MPHRPPVVTARRAMAGALAVLALTAGSACSAGGVPPVVVRTPGASSPAVVAVPDDGVLLRSFGFRNGPVGSFSLPRDAQAGAVVDQADNVTVVLTAPSAAAVFTYLSAALPQAGYTVTAADPDTSTLTFTGQGWSGSLTGEDQTSAVVLRPA